MGILENKVAVITGPSKGLGFAMAMALAAEGADLVGIDVGDMDEIECATKELGRSFVAIQADFTQTHKMTEVAASAIAAFEKVDILVNNAGVIYRSEAENFPDEGFDFVMDVNVKALFMLTREIGRHMKENQYGKIVNVGSIQSIQGGNMVSAYVASKHAVAGITRAFANEWGKYGITVNAIAPGFMITDNTAKLREQTDRVTAITNRIPAGRWGVPQDLAGPVVFLASDASKYVNGHLLVVDGGYINN